MNPKVTVIVPNYNHCQYLVERLDSIFNQTYQDFEVIVFDDASTDNSLVILNRYIDNPKVSYFIKNKKNSGSPFQQWKKGMRLAKGEYIWIAETDDFASHNFLEEQIKGIQGYDGAVSRAIIVENSVITQKEVYESIFENSNNVILSSNMFMVCPIKNVSCVLFKKPTLIELDEMKFDSFPIIGDQFFYFEYFNGKKFFFNRNAISYFRRVDSSISNVNSSKRLEYFSNYYRQHITFSKLLQRELGKDFVKEYKKRYFNKVKNHTSRKQKISFRYAYIMFVNYLNF